MLRKRAPNSAAVVITDLPFGVINRPTSGLRVFDKGKADDASTFNLEEFAREALRAAPSVYVFCASEQISTLRGTFIAAKASTRLMVWEKTNPSPANGQHLWLSGIEVAVFARRKNATFNAHCRNTVFRHAVVQGKKRIHKTQKPTKLLQDWIEVSSNPGDLVIDPFAGSGSTGVAALATGRRFLGAERVASFADKARAWLRATV